MSDKLLKLPTSQDDIFPPLPPHPTSPTIRDAIMEQKQRLFQHLGENRKSWAKLSRVEKLDSMYRKSWAKLSRVEKLDSMYKFLPVEEKKFQACDFDKKFIR